MSGQPAGRWVTACRVRLELMFKMADSRGKDETKFNHLKGPQKASFFKHFLRGGSILNVSNEDDLFFTRDNGLL